MTKIDRIKAEIARNPIGYVCERMDKVIVRLTREIEADRNFCYHGTPTDEVCGEGLNDRMIEQGGSTIL
jgi:hypothetical protein